MNEISYPEKKRAAKRNLIDNPEATASTALSRRRISSTRCMSIEPREENERTSAAQTVWKNLKSWIVSHGGYVHPNLDFRTDDRVLHYSPSISQSKTDEYDTMNTGTVLATIPQSCLLTIDTVMQSAVGTQLSNAIENALLANNNGNEKRNEFVRDFRDDVLLSLYMATLLETNQDSAANGNASNFFNPYLDSLPPSETYDALPRRWSDEKLKTLLGGTSLYHRVVQEKENLRCAYDSIQTSFHKLEQQNEEKVMVEFASYSAWDDMYAAVSSRGFAGMGYNNSSKSGGDAMVPLLDLLDHKRGMGQKRDVQYKRKQNEKDKEQCSVEVICDSDILPNVPICDTYGAKGNPQLLYRYGFCIPNNIEPDGTY